MKAHLGTRTFLLCFLPFALLLTVGFWTIQRFVQVTVGDGLRASLRSGQATIASVHATTNLQNSRFLRIAGENSSLKAGIQILRQNSQSADARATVEDQLRELGERMGFDFMLISSADGRPLAGIYRRTTSSTSQGELIPLGLAALDHVRSGLTLLNGKAYQVASVPVDIGGENIALLSVGESVDLKGLLIPVALIHRKDVIATNLPAGLAQQLSGSLSACDTREECELRLAGSTWISMPMEAYNDGYALLSFQDVDLVTAPVKSHLRRLFLIFGLISLSLVILSSYLSSRSIVQPVALIVDHLRRAAQTGGMSELHMLPSSILEVEELAQIYNGASASIRLSKESLENAYLQFVGSLANALDARDPYTAGHSYRVSHLSCRIAEAMGFASKEIERIKIGALLHDIGKIGIADSVLQKPGRLTEEEFALIRQHPIIGRKILEGVKGFSAYLGAVELHHENWDGTGYPHRQRQTETAVDARIIHIADAYDAMTTNRSYRRGMTHKKAISILIEYAAIQFDPEIVATFVRLMEQPEEEARRPDEVMTLSAVEVLS